MTPVGDPRRLSTDTSQKLHTVDPTTAVHGVRPAPERTYSQSMLRYTVREEHRSVRTRDYVRDLVDVPKFLGFCRACSRHDQTWGCPEFDFDPLEVWGRYEWFHLTARIMEFMADQPRTGLSHEELVGDVMAMFHREKMQAHRELVALHRRVTPSMALSAGACELCAECTRPLGKPCRIPDQLFHSIESLGGDVATTMSQLFDHPVEWSDGDRLPDSYLVVTGLLCDANEAPMPVHRSSSASEHPAHTSGEDISVTGIGTTGIHVSTPR